MREGRKHSRHPQHLNRGVGMRRRGSLLLMMLPMASLQPQAIGASQNLTEKIISITRDPRDDVITTIVNKHTVLQVHVTINGTSLGTARSTESDTHWSVVLDEILTPDSESGVHIVQSILLKWSSPTKTGVADLSFVVPANVSRTFLLSLFENKRLVTRRLANVHMLNSLENRATNPVVSVYLEGTTHYIGPKDMQPNKTVSSQTKLAALLLLVIWMFQSLGIPPSTRWNFCDSRSLDEAKDDEDRCSQQFEETSKDADYDRSESATFLQRQSFSHYIDHSSDDDSCMPPRVVRFSVDPSSLDGLPQFLGERVVHEDQRLSSDHEPMMESDEYVMNSPLPKNGGCRNASVPTSRENALKLSESLSPRRAAVVSITTLNVLSTYSSSDTKASHSKAIEIDEAATAHHDDSRIPDEENSCHSTSSNSTSACDRPLDLSSIVIPLSIVARDKEGSIGNVPAAENSIKASAAKLVAHEDNGEIDGSNFDDIQQVVGNPILGSEFFSSRNQQLSHPDRAAEWSDSALPIMDALTDVDTIRDSVQDGCGQSSAKDFDVLPDACPGTLAQNPDDNPNHVHEQTSPSGSNADDAPGLIQPCLISPLPQLENVKESVPNGPKSTHSTSETLQESTNRFSVPSPTFAPSETKDCRWLRKLSRRPKTELRIITASRRLSHEQCSLSPKVDATRGPERGRTSKVSSRSLSTYVPTSECSVKECKAGSSTEHWHQRPRFPSHLSPTPLEKSLVQPGSASNGDDFSYVSTLPPDSDACSHVDKFDFHENSPESNRQRHSSLLNPQTRKRKREYGNVGASIMPPKIRKDAKSPGGLKSSLEGDDNDVDFWEPVDAEVSILRRDGKKGMRRRSNPSVSTMMPDIIPSAVDIARQVNAPVWEFKGVHSNEEPGIVRKTG